MGILVVAAFFGPSLALVLWRQGTWNPFTPSSWPRALARAWVPCASTYAGLAALFFVAMLGTHAMTSRVRPEPGLPADLAGVREGDRVVAVDGVRVRWMSDISAARESSKSAPSVLELERGTERLTVTVAPTAEGVLGLRAFGELASPSAAERGAKALAAPAQAIAIYFSATVAAIRGTTTGRVERKLGGPVAVVSPVARDGGSIIVAVAFNGAVFWPFTVAFALVLSALPLAWRRRQAGPPP